MKTYNIEGKVLGNLWGGGKGSYPMESFQDVSNIQVWKQEWEKKLDLLDSGMGFDGVKGAILWIIEITTIIKDGKKYSRDSNFIVDYIGNLTEEEKQFLEWEDRDV